MSTRTNVLRRTMRPNTKSYRAAVASIIRSVQAQHGLSDADLAEQIGCSVGTIQNARNERSNLDGVFLANLQFTFGADAIDHFQALSAARGVPEGATVDQDLNTIRRLAEAIAKLADAMEDDSEAGSDIGPTEAKELLPVLRAARSELDKEIARISPRVVRSA